MREHLGFVAKTVLFSMLGYVVIEESRVHLGLGTAALWYLVGLAALGAMVWASRRMLTFEAAFAALRTSDFEHVPRIPDIGEIVDRLKAKPAPVQLKEASLDFLPVIAHELQTPLATIEGYANLLAESDTPEEWVSAIRHAVAQQRILIEDLLDLAKLEKETVSVQDVRLDDVVSRAIKDTLPAAEAKHVTFRTNIQPGIEVQTDADRLQQVLKNLLMNAVRFAPSGDRIDVRVRDQKDRIAIEVSEIRMPTPNYGRFVDEAMRGKTYGGTGVGFAVARAIVHRLHGEIRATPSPDSGTTITITLPRPE